MRSALDNEEFAGIAFGRVVRSRELVHKPMFVVDAAAPVAVHVPKRPRLADANVAVALDVLDEQVDPLENLLVFQLPARIFIPGARREREIHSASPSQAEYAEAFGVRAEEGAGEDVQAAGEHLLAVRPRVRLRDAAPWCLVLGVRPRVRLRDAAPPQDEGLPEECKV